MKALATLVAAASLGIVLSTNAFAAHEIPAACQADAANLCPGMAPGDGRFGKCMKSHEGQVSTGCKEAARAMRREHEHHEGERRTTQPMTPTPQPVPATNQ